MADYSGTLIPAFADPINGVFNGVFNGAIINTNAPVQFAQRVWSTGTLVWCYYVGDITSTPLASQTTPPWVGSAVRHEVLGPV